MRKSEPAQNNEDAGHETQHMTKHTRFAKQTIIKINKTQKIGRKTTTAQCTLGQEKHEPCGGLLSKITKDYLGLGTLVFYQKHFPLPRIFLISVYFKLLHCVHEILLI